MSKSQRDKGKRVEREACALLRSFGYQAERTVQYSGKNPDASDVRASIPGLYIEVKGGYDGAELGSKIVSGWFERAEADCGSRRPVVLWKRTRKDWLVLARVEGLIVATAEVRSALTKISEYAAGEIKEIQP